MKCQRKASPYSACLRSRSCARFSPTTSTPASTRMAMSSSDTYLVAATIVTSGPISPRMSSYAARTLSGDTRDHSLAAARQAGAPVREEKVRVAARADVDPLDVLDARLAQRAFGRTPEVGVAAADDVPAER